MDIIKIEKIFELFATTDIAEVEIKEGDDSIRISRYSSQIAAPVAMQMTTAYPASQPLPAANPPLTAPATLENKPATPPDAAPGHAVKSPMVGTFYRSPSPNSKSFVEVGQFVNKGDTLCIIEAMKILNQIEADVSGTIIAILAENGQAVEYDQPLFMIK